MTFQGLYEPFTLLQHTPSLQSIKKCGTVCLIIIPPTLEMKRLQHQRGTTYQLITKRHPWQRHRSASSPWECRDRDNRQTTRVYSSTSQTLSVTSHSPNINYTRINKRSTILDTSTGHAGDSAINLAVGCQHFLPGAWLNFPSTTTLRLVIN